MKKLLSLVLICLLAIPAFACAQVFEAASAGFGGEVKVALTIEDGKIVDAKVTGDSETPGIGAAALEPLAAQLVAAGSAEIDGVAGATVTSDAVRAAAAAALAEASGETAAEAVLADGAYTVEVTLEGGSGKASVESPARLTVQDGAATAVIIWSSSNYDYMKVDGVRCDPINTEGNSTFEIPVLGFDYKMPVLADTTAMSTPHEIEYTLYFDSASLQVSP